MLWVGHALVLILPALGKCATLGSFPWAPDQGGGHRAAAIARKTIALTPAQKLRELLAEPNVEIMPGCYDALSAKLVADAGYKVTFMSGLAVSAARLGLPDA